MPEIAEVAICADFIRDKCQNLIFWEIPQKSDSSKVKIVLDIPLPFTLSASTRGKELMLIMTSLEEDFPEKKMIVTLGMSGNIKAVKSLTPIKFADLPKHTHLAFFGKIINKTGENNGYCAIALVDPRRFAKWKWADSFSLNRGADPIQEHLLFREDLKKRIDNDKKFADKILAEALLDQSSFNGIGNYLRSTILYHLDINPFLKISEVAKDNLAIEKLLDLCKEIPQFFYQQKGGQLRDWKNPFGANGNFSEILFYQKGESLYDSGKRRFWYNPKWKGSIEQIEFQKSLTNDK